MINRLIPSNDIVSGTKEEIEQELPNLNNGQLVSVNNRDLIEDIFDFFYPVGAILVQFPGELPPEERWHIDGVEWKLMNWNGVFFRASGGLAEGFKENGLADDFTDEDDTEGDKTYQKCGVPNATGDVRTKHPLASFAIGVGVQDPHGVFTVGENRQGGWGDHDYSNTPGRFYMNLRRASTVYQDGLTEARPDNITVNVWKRVA